jgi:cytochrome P450
MDQHSWGLDSRLYRPSRWITTDKSGNQEIITPARGTFLPWSSGPRVCPGRKMAEVEFVSILATLFRKCRIEPVLESGETMKQAGERLWAVLRDCEAKLVLEMNHPEKARLRWKRR